MVSQVLLCLFYYKPVENFTDHPPPPLLIYSAIITYMNTTKKLTTSNKTPKSKLAKTAPPTTPTKSNKYIYTEQWFYNEVTTMLDDLIANEQIKSKAELLTLKHYSPSRFYRYKAKYNTSKRIDEVYQKINNILEARLINQGLTGKNFPFVIFLLKNHYGYQDKKEVETETTHVFKVARGNKVIDIQPAQVKQILNKSKAPNEQ